MVLFNFNNQNNKNRINQQYLRKKLESILMSILIGIIIIYFILGCALKGKKLTSTGQSGVPKVAWTGSNFGILYGHLLAPFQYQYRIMTVDQIGTILKTNTNLGGYEFNFTPFLFSDLVWNSSTNNQFAFAYNNLDTIMFKRLNTNLNEIGNSLKIVLPLIKGYKSQLRDISLVWNSVRKEYGLVFVENQHPYIPNYEHPVYFVAITEAGKIKVTPQKIFQAPSAWYSRPSITYDKKTGQYAVACFKLYGHVKIGFFSPGNPISKYDMMTGWKIQSLGMDLRIVCDDGTGDYMVAAIKDPGELCYQIVNKKGTPITGNLIKSGSQSYERIFSVTNYGFKDYSYLISISTDKNQIHTWLVTENGYDKTDLAFSDPKIICYHPFICSPDNLSIYVAWIQDGDLYFGNPEF